MAYTTVNKSSEHFSPKIFTGNGSTNAITGVGHEPSLTWLKSRSGANDHQLYDSVRGATKYLRAESNDGEGTAATGLTAFNSDGFTLGSAGTTNVSGGNMASWNWKAGTTSGISAGSQTITPSSYSINTTSGFGIYKWSRTGASTTDYFSHGLGATPTLALQKRTDLAQDWYVNYTFGSSANQNIHLNNTNGFEDDSTTVPTSTNYYPKSPETGDYITYLFAPVQGFSKFGVYIGNGNTNGPFIYTGFKPAFIIVKNIWDSSGGSNAGGNWKMLDRARDPYNVAQRVLLPDNSASETASTDHYTDFCASGFKIRNTSNQMNQNTGSGYFYMAFAEAPLVGSNNIAATAA